MYSLLGSKAKLYWLTEYTIAYQINVYTLDGHNILNVSKSQSECLEKFCNMTIESLNLNQKYVFDVKICNKHCRHQKRRCLSET